MHKDCTLYKTMDFIGKRWTLLILLELHKGENTRKRYNLLKKQLPDITAKILSLRLKELVDQGLISKFTDASTVPVKCEYELTQAGLAFIKIIQDIKQWALKWKFSNKACEAEDCRRCFL